MSVESTDEQFVVRSDDSLYDIFKGYLRVKRAAIWYTITIFVVLLFSQRIDDVIFYPIYFGSNTDVRFFDLRQLFAAVIYTIILLILVSIGFRFARAILPKIGLVPPTIDLSKIEVRLKEILKKNSSLGPVELATANRIQAIFAIDGRVELLRSRATFMLVTIGILLIGTCMIIIFAGSLTSLDVSAVNDIDRLSSLMSDTEANITKLSNAEAILKKLDTAKEGDEKISLQRDLTFYGTVPKTVDGTSALIQSNKDRLTEYKALLDKAWGQEISNPHGYEDTKYLVATAITRVGVVFVLIFLVQILFNLYRYNTRLVTFYLARRDLIQLWDGDQKTLDGLEKTLNPSIEFGKEPKHPIEEVVNQIIAKIPSLQLQKQGAEGSPQ